MNREIRSIEAPLGENVVVADRFQLVRELGSGSMGSVWLARHQALAIPCAVKFIRGEGAAEGELRSRFEREARAAAQIRSPHVVQILDHGVWRGHPYIAMEYLEGESLGSRLLRYGRLPASEVFALATQIARGLTRAHALGIVHRDLKPDNIFLVPDDLGLPPGHPSAGAGVTAKILDFGIAKSPRLDGDRFSGTQTGMLMGTPYYMSPEQADGTRTVDARSDLWSLAVVVYQCLVGKLPFESDAIGDLLMQVMNYPIPVPSRVAPDLSPGFDAWWARALERDPDRRFQSAAELVAALDGVLGSGPATEMLGASPVIAAFQRAGATQPPPALPLRTLSAGFGLSTSQVIAADAGTLHRPGWMRAAVGAVAAGALIGAAVFAAHGDRPTAALGEATSAYVEMAPRPAASASASTSASTSTSTSTSASTSASSSSSTSSSTSTSASSSSSASASATAAPLVLPAWTAAPRLQSPPARSGSGPARLPAKQPSKKPDVGF